MNLNNIYFLGFTNSLQQTMEALVLFFFLAREAEKTVSRVSKPFQLASFTAKCLIFTTCCGCTVGGAEVRKSTDSGIIHKDVLVCLVISHLMAFLRDLLNRTRLPAARGMLCSFFFFFFYFLGLFGV